MIEYIRDMIKFSRPIDKFPHTLEGMIAIIHDQGCIRCPAWGAGKTIIKFDEKYIYVESDTKGKIDVFNAHGDKVMKIKKCGREINLGRIVLSCKRPIPPA